MFDDVLSATALISVAGLLATAIVSLGSSPESGARATAATNPRSGHAMAHAGTAPATAKMPLYDLPRVVVTGQRLRDGDVMADCATMGDPKPTLARR